MNTDIFRQKTLLNVTLLFSAYLFLVSSCYGETNKQPNNLLIEPSSNLMINSNNLALPFTDLEKIIASKMAVDIRYFCDDGHGDKVKPEQLCLYPVTQLPDALAEMVTKSGIGSVVLFAENLVDSNQVIQLTHDLQQAAIKSVAGQPLIISVDQEGGRVVRFAKATAFAGNMAIGATYPAHGVKFAKATSEVIGQELKALGINNNYAPVVDVNTNADNPVINTRSYGEDPQRVAKLGVAAVKGFQQQGVMATLKHFPGHGDTHVDSHLGLPMVEHDLSIINKQDLAPFQWAIKHSDPAMIMTAHIQYPALDDSTIENNEGELIIRPATMSRKILTDLLRNKLAYEGIIATDALDMAGIAHYFDEVTAVVETFVAGADLAVMPFKIRSNKDIDSFYHYIRDVARVMQQKIDATPLLMKELKQSVARINGYKALYCQLSPNSIAKKSQFAEDFIATTEHLTLEQRLADNAVVLLKNKLTTLPIATQKIARIHLFVLNWQEFRALKRAIVSRWQQAGQVIPEVSATVVAEFDQSMPLSSEIKLSKADLLIATIDTKIASVVDIGGMEDLNVAKKSKGYTDAEQNKVSYQRLLTEQLKHAQQQNIASILIAKGSPYLLTPYTDITDAILVTFDDRILSDINGQDYSPGYNTSMAIAVGKQAALGKLPISLK